MPPVEQSSQLPRVGMLATVRNRRGLISSVEPFDGGTEGRLHLVSVEYTDTEFPPDDQLLWEREPNATLLEPTALPEVSTTAPMLPEEFDALVRATRWTAISPFVDPDGDQGPLTRFPIASPFHGAIQVDDFQLVPLLKALRMPRVALLLADDVGLGKTVEAGLILTELLIRRRVRRAMIICPASLRSQWRQEMRDKFALTFDEIDRDSTQTLRKRLGLDANPWRTFPRIVTSYYYLKQPDVLEEFRAASRTAGTSAHLPWDLLIVDEVHNLTPAAYGEDSELAEMLTAITPYFEHKLFLTATPHNGHTRSFTGLLERLDPVRFSQTDELKPAERARIEQVLVRRLKSEINARTNPKRFCERSASAIHIGLQPAEKQLADSFQGFRRKVRTLIAKGKRAEQLAGAFAVEILGKRLLSCPVAFADSWHRYQIGLQDVEHADTAEVRAADRAVREETGDDREAEERTGHAARIVGAWLKPLAPQLMTEMAQVEEALRALHLDRRNVPPAEQRPTHDARVEAVHGFIEKYLRQNGTWRTDERLIIFTEYKTTLDYLECRLRTIYPEPSAIRVLYGELTADRMKRDAIIKAFNDPNDPVRILVATDAASEGLNLQETARYLLHFDVPWNPARIEQRNGRLDRHGQARDVTVFHFTSDDDADIAFLSYVIGKVHTIREDLGSVGEVFEAAFQQRLIEGDELQLIQRQVDERVTQVRGRAAVPREAATSTQEIQDDDRDGVAEAVRLKALADELDLDADTLRDTLEVALGIGSGRPRFEAVDAGRVRLKQPIPPSWLGLIDDSLRLPAANGQKGPLPSLVFDPASFIRTIGGRQVFRPSKDTVLLHLAHPLYHRALAGFARARFPGGDSAYTATRWTVRPGPVPSGAEALVLLTLEELAVNKLRESFHHWIRTVRIPIKKSALEEPLPHEPAKIWRVTSGPVRDTDRQQAKVLWDEIYPEVRELVHKACVDLSATLRQALEAEYQEARKREAERFQSRQGELSALIEQQSLARLEREIEALRTAQQQGVLFDSEKRLEELARSEEAKREELARRRAHYEELRQQLARERDRIIEHLLPKRYALHGDAQVFPVAVEIRLPEESR